MGDGTPGNTDPERERNTSADRDERDEAGALTGRAVTPDKSPHSGEGPDVFLDVPELKVDEFSLEVEDLEAHVSLVAQVLDLLKLNVGADVRLGRVKLEIKGVEAEARLEVRLDNVAVIVDRVLTTLDRNPEILQHIGRGVEAATRDLGSGAGTAVGEVGRGAKGAVEDVGRGAGGAVESVGEGAGGAVKDVGRGAGGAVENVGEGAGGAVENVGEGAGGAVKDVGRGAGGAVEDAGEGVRDVGKGAGDAAKSAGEGAGEAAGKTAEGVTGTADDGNDGNDETNSDNEEEAEDEPEITALQTALHETGESVRDLGRSLLRMLSQHSHSQDGEKSDSGK